MEGKQNQVLVLDSKKLGKITAHSGVHSRRSLGKPSTSPQTRLLTRKEKS